jgi:hypothetical protein
MLWALLVANMATLGAECWLATITLATALPLLALTGSALYAVAAELWADWA